MKKDEVIEEQLLKKIETMVINGSYLTGQHYGQGDWGVIVKGLALNIYLMTLSEILQAQTTSIQEAVAEERERVRELIEKNDLGLYSGDVKSIVDLLESLDKLKVDKES